MRATIDAAAAASARGEKRTHEDAYPEPGGAAEDPAQLKARLREQTLVCLRARHARSAEHSPACLRAAGQDSALHDGPARAAWRGAAGASTALGLMCPVLPRALR